MSRLADLNTTDYSEFVQVDPTGRYGRYNEVLSRGATKTVYRAFDEFEGIEVAWNQVKLDDYIQQSADLERLYAEIYVRKTLKHENIINFYTSWVDTVDHTLNSVTHIFAYSLRLYRLKHSRVVVRIMKHWCKEILRGLDYLHSHEPPIVHGDLKCDNIFIDGNKRSVKIGDLGLVSTIKKPDAAARFLGTPEFIAPEVYEGNYNHLADIYSFGMCILEMITTEYPYSECTDHSEIRKKVTSGEKPDVLYKVEDPEIKAFVEKCLAPLSLRPSAKDLLDDPFLQSEQSESDSRPLRDVVNRFVATPNGDNYEAQNEKKHQFEIDSNLSKNPENVADEHSRNVVTNIKGKRRDDGVILLRLQTTDENGRIRKIYYPFDVRIDTAFDVAAEMMIELGSTDLRFVKKIADMIDTEISSLVSEWRPTQWNAKAGRNPFFNNQRLNLVPAKPSVPWNEMAGRRFFLNNEGDNPVWREPTHWTAMAGRKPFLNNRRHNPFGARATDWRILDGRNPVMNNPLGIEPSFWPAEAVEEHGSRNDSSNPTEKPTILPEPSPEDLPQPIERDTVSEQQSEQLADMPSNHQEVLQDAPKATTSPLVARLAKLIFKFFRRRK